MKSDQARNWALVILGIGTYLGARVSILVIVTLALAMSLYDRDKKDDPFLDKFWFYLLIISFLGLGFILVQVNPEQAQHW